ncbi:2TM domain-containing protein [Janthinobacterium sp. 17J80-10]|uniref:2TM domain-containing protein n=1 Tax=Janthinobacterium sp. 17J80-10 TaxID=2497863 RepID=UPI00100556D0|nr:2TM domain-containing protein [Janthinobacterium sp. 17J80-10]QAU33768.1 2TM domain-containing protein [Janthinobacterium sp. 17J80-10]
MDDNNVILRQATRQVERKIGFRIHLSVYIIVNTGLIVLSQLTTPGHFWPLGPIFGWGIGLAMHGMAVYLRADGSRWKQRMIEQEIRKQQA